MIIISLRHMSIQRHIRAIFHLAGRPENVACHGWARVSIPPPPPPPSSSRAEKCHSQGLDHVDLVHHLRNGEDGEDEDDGDGEVGEGS